jgi:hypothetical protein
VPRRRGDADEVEEPGRGAEGRWGVRERKKEEGGGRRRVKKSEYDMWVPSVVVGMEYEI